MNLTSDGYWQKLESTTLFISLCFFIITKRNMHKKLKNINKIIISRVFSHDLYSFRVLFNKYLEIIRHSALFLYTNNPLNKPLQQKRTLPSQINLPLQFLFLLSLQHPTLLYTFFMFLSRIFQYFLFRCIQWFLFLGRIYN